MSRGVVTPQDILGVSHTATLEEIRRAYRIGALKYHPDNFRQNPSKVEEKFRELARAYKAALRAHLPEYEEGDGTRAYSPADLARIDTQWHRDQANRRYDWEYFNQRMMQDTAKSRSIATVDENRIFVVAWAAATILGIAVSLAVGLLGLVGDLRDGMDISDILAGQVTALLVTALATAGAR